MRIELASIPASQADYIFGFTLGAKSILANMPNPSGNDPMDIETEYRRSGNCHIYLITGRWIGPHEADFSSCYQDVADADNIPPSQQPVE